MNSEDEDMEIIENIDLEWIDGINTLNHKK